MKYGHRNQRGFAAIAAIFLVVILAALGGFMLTFSNSQQLTSAQDVQGTRAYWAARAGLEWAVVAIPAAPTLCTNPVAAPPSPVDGFTVTVRCFESTYTDGANTVIIDRFESVASMGAVGAVGFVERSVSASLER